jgi:hypothetical protein
MIVRRAPIYATTDLDNGLASSDASPECVTTQPGAVKQ